MRSPAHAAGRRQRSSVDTKAGAELQPEARAAGGTAGRQPSAGGEGTEPSGRTSCLATLALVTLVLLYRKPHALLEPQFWAEDGSVFFHEQRWHGLQSFLQPYAGYLHLVPRTIAALASLFPIRAEPIVYNYCSLVVVLAIAAALFSPRLPVARRPLLALSLVLVPAGPHQAIFLNVTNVQWPLSLGLVLLVLMKPPRTRWGACLDLLALAFIGLTGPFILVALPLFALRWMRERSRYALVLLLAAAALAIVQALVLASSYQALPAPPASSAEAWTTATGVSLAGRMFFGEALGSLLPVGLLALGSAALPVLLLWLTDFHKERVRFVGASLFFGIAVLAMTFYKFQDTPRTFSTWLGSERHQYPFYVACLWGLVVGLDSGRRWKRATAGGLLTLMLLTTFTGFRAVAFEDHDWPERSAALERGDLSPIPINPQGWGILPEKRPLGVYRKRMPPPRPARPKRQPVGKRRRGRPGARRETASRSRVVTPAAARGAGRPRTP